MPDPNYDPWREVVNGADTYAAIATDLRERGACVIGWTDGEGTHHDVLFTLRPARGCCSTSTRRPASAARCAEACAFDPAEGHTVRMTLDHSVNPSLSVATCECGGFVHTVPWRPDTRFAQDLVIAAHWQAMRQQERKAS